MIRIVVDSSSDYRKEELEEKQLTLVPLTVNFGENSYIEGKNMERDTFYKMLTESSEFPKTSQPSPDAFLKVFEEAKAQGDTLICILLSSALSGTCQSAILAKSMVDYENIYIIDSLAATHPIRIMVDYACSLVQAGMSAPDIVNEIENLKSRVKIIAVPGTLEYLAKGGRISRTIAALGEMAKLKPVLALMEDGTIGILGKCLGRNKAFSHMISHILAQGIDERFPRYSIYSYGTENCEKFEEKLNEKGIACDERLQIGVTIGAHVGPEAFGLVYVAKA